MARKFDFDYNFDPEGTSPVTPDPYTDNPIDERTANGVDHENLDRLIPTAPKLQNRARSRSKSPLPSPEVGPSPEYIAISLESCSKLEPNGKQRKLLILDLNGTLVFRSAHQKRNAYQMQGNARPLRSVHKRPYLLTFTEYLFDPNVRSWLDTMVWSSAQPHSVADMVENCFEGRKDELAAIWARDTLGLTPAEYNRKTQTTKDLSKPWTHFARLNHSAKTTLLLDDSPLKAHLQPWNHLCIKEYVAEMRKNDARVREAELVQESLDAMTEDPLPSKKRKDNEKKARKREERIAKGAAGAIGEDGQPLEYDQTLLAVVGILDTIKNESNVAAWMRNGGLVDVHSARSRSATPGPPKKRRYSDESARSSTSESSVSGSSSPIEPPGSSLPTHLHPPSDSEGQQEDTGVPLLDSKIDKSHPPGLWFDHPDAFHRWVAQGRRALDALGIEVHHGITSY